MQETTSLLRYEVKTSPFPLVILSPFPFVFLKGAILRMLSTTEEAVVLQGRVLAELPRAKRSTMGNKIW